MDSSNIQVNSPAPRNNQESSTSVESLGRALTVNFPNIKETVKLNLHFSTQKQPKHWYHTQVWNQWVEHQPLTYGSPIYRL